ncbi:MAG: hypothetical protein ACYSUD_20955 [Planctomycetota bacterium]|jgi:hypothetical protein
MPDSGIPAGHAILYARHKADATTIRPLKGCVAAADCVMMNEINQG